jgi:hypothetical protein
VPAESVPRTRMTRAANLSNRAMTAKQRIWGRASWRKGRTASAWRVS